MNDETYKPLSEKAIRGPDGRYLAGMAPGRPPGSRNKISREAIGKIRELNDDAFRALKENVAKNDQRAIEYVLDRILPRGRVVELDATGEGLRDSVIDGDLSADEIRAISGAISNIKKIDEIDQLRADLDAMRKLLEG